ncbi:MAG: DUF721 domain-containing protein [Bifidobacteriaceae bacterium]|nr:DUF721 domain-containing protein [Bifidobacteriaceae bacterium]
MKKPIAQSLGMNGKKLAHQIFVRYIKSSGKRVDWNKIAEESFENFGKEGREPAIFGDVLSVLSNNSLFVVNMKIAQLNIQWETVVGNMIAQHSYVESYNDGVIIIRAQSNAWATNLEYMKDTLLKKIQEELNGLTVSKIIISGPKSSHFQENAKKRK